MSSILNKNLDGTFLVSNIREFLKFKYHLYPDIGSVAAPTWNTFDDPIDVILRFWLKALQHKSISSKWAKKSLSKPPKETQIFFLIKKHAPLAQKISLLSLYCPRSSSRESKILPLQYV